MTINKTQLFPFFPLKRVLEPIRKYWHQSIARDVTIKCFQKLSKRIIIQFLQSIGKLINVRFILLQKVICFKITSVNICYILLWFFYLFDCIIEELQWKFLSIRDNEVYESNPKGMWISFLCEICLVSVFLHTLYGLKEFVK